MRYTLLLLSITCMVVAQAQSDTTKQNSSTDTTIIDTGTGNSKETDSDIISSPAIRATGEYIPFVCEDSDVKYVFLDTISHYYTLIIANKDRRLQPDSIVFKNNYSDQTVDFFLSKALGKSACYTENRKSLLSQIREAANRLYQSESSRRDRATVDSLEQELEKEYTAGIFHSISKEIPVYNYKDSSRSRVASWFMNKRARNTYYKNYPDNPAFIRYHKATDTSFIVDQISVRTDYNRISKISVAGFLKYRDVLTKKDTSLHLVFANTRYSLSLPALNEGLYIYKLPILSDSSLYINFADIIQYEPFAGEMSYIISNQSLNVPVGGTVQIKKRKLSDYTSFRTFLDPLGFLGNNPNGFAQLEGDVIVPMALRSRGRWTVFPQANVNFNYIYSNSINSEPRIAPVYTLATNEIPLPLTKTARFVNNLDFVKYSYYLLKANLSFLGIELKNWSSWMHIEGGIRVMGTKVDTSAGNSVTIHKLIPEARVRLEIRPDYILGASLAVGVAWLANSHEGNNSPENVRDISFLYRSMYTIPHELNVYAITGNGTGGLFFRYVGWVAFHRKLGDGINVSTLPLEAQIRKSSYFPQILLGYATNLSALVNRIPKQRAY